MELECAYLPVIRQLECWWSDDRQLCFSVLVDGAPKMLLEIVAFPGGLGHDPQYNQPLAQSGDALVVHMAV